MLTFIRWDNEVGKTLFGKHGQGYKRKDGWECVCGGGGGGGLVSKGAVRRDVFTCFKGPFPHL